MNAEFRKTLVQHATQMSNESQRFVVNQKFVPQGEPVKIAVSLWETNWVKEEFYNLMTNFEGNTYVHPDENVMMLLIKKVIYTSRKMDIATVIGARQTFELIVEEMGMQLFEWLKQVWIKLEKYDRVNYEKTLRVYIDNIMWTPSGRLDYEKIILTLLEGNKFPSEFTKFFELSVYSFEDRLKEFYANAKKAIKEFIEKLIQERCKNFDDDKVEHQYDYYLQAYWLYRLANNVETISVDDLTGEYGRTFDHSIDENQTGEGNFFALSAYYGHHYSLKYFWNRMSQNERNIFAIESLIHSVNENFLWEFYGSKTEVLTFFFNTMGDGFVKFLESLYNGRVPLIMIAVVLTMPFQNFYFPTLNEISQFLPNKSNPLVSSVYPNLVTFLKRNGELTSQGQSMRIVIQKIFNLVDYQVV